MPSALLSKTELDTPRSWHSVSGRSAQNMLPLDFESTAKDAGKSMKQYVRILQP